MKKRIIAALLSIAAVLTMLLSGCGNAEEARVNDFIRENAVYAAQISTLKNLYGDAMDVKSYGKGKDLVIELDVKASIGDSMNDADLTGVEESLQPHLVGLRAKTENNESNIIYIVKDKDGKEIVNKTIS